MAAGLLAAPAAAPGAVTIGPDLSALNVFGPASFNCSATKDCTMLTTALGSRPAAPGGLSSPVTGHVVSMTVKTNAVTGATVTPRVIRPAGGLAFTGISTGTELSFPANAVTTVPLPSPLAIKAGDYVGVNCCQQSNDSITSTEVPGSNSAFSLWGSVGNPILADGTTDTPDTTLGNLVLTMNATIEPQNSVRIDASRTTKKRVFLTITPPNDGVVTIEPPNAIRKKCKGPRCGPNAAPASFTVQAGQQTVISSRLRKLVKRVARARGKVRFNVLIGFTPELGTEGIQSSPKLTLKAKRKKRKQPGA